MVFTIRIRGGTSLRQAAVKIRNLTKDFQFALLDESAKEGKRIMRQMVPVGVRTNGLHNSVIVTPIRKGDTTATVRFTNPNQKVADFNEFGVRPHFRTISKDPDLARWVKSHIPDYRGNTILIGGPASRIKRGQSQNKFIDKTSQVLSERINTIAQRAERRIRTQSR